MQITNQTIDELRENIRSYMSEKRYNHTLGVEETAAKLGEYCLQDKVAELRCAALLHDIAKDLSKEEQMAIMKLNSDITDSDFASPPAHHAFCAPYLVRRDFAHLASADILSAVFNHTTGDKEMSIFDEIIFIADYIEPGREYPECIHARDELLKNLRDARDGEECLLWLHKAVIEALNNTIISLTKRGMYINERTVATRNALVGRMPMPLA